jgi:hypothetical protein
VCVSAARAADRICETSREFTTAKPVRPSVPLINMTERLKVVMAALEPAWEAAAARNAWFAAYAK